MTQGFWAALGEVWYGLYEMSFWPLRIAQAVYDTPATPHEKAPPTLIAVQHAVNEE